MWLFLNPPLLFCVEKAMVSHTLRGSGNSLAGWNTCQVHHICHPSAPWCMCTFFFGETRTRSIQLVFITLRLCTVVCNWDHTQSWRSEKITLLASHLLSKMGLRWFGVESFLDFQLWKVTILQPLDLWWWILAHLKALIHICLHFAEKSIEALWRYVILAQNNPIYVLTLKQKWSPLYLLFANII